MSNWSRSSPKSKHTQVYKYPIQNKPTSDPKQKNTLRSYPPELTIICVCVFFVKHLRSVYETIPPHTHKTIQKHVFIPYLSTWKCIPMYFEIQKSFSKCNYVAKVCIGTLHGRTHSLSIAKQGGRVISMLLTCERSFFNS